MKKFIILPFLFAVVACNNPCSSPSSLANQLTNIVVPAWKCSNQPQVLSDISAVCEKYNLCAATTSAVKESGKETGPIASVACPLIISSLQGIAQGQIPATWGCTNVAGNAATALTILCSSLPF
jgi:hypothetical protein